MSDDIKALREQLGEIADLKSAIALLQWDHEVYMPPKAAPGRGQQLATLCTLCHKMFTSPEMGGMLKKARDGAGELSPDDAALISETLYDYERETKLPESFVKTFAVEQSKAYEEWTKARAESDFKMFQPSLERVVELLKEKAELLGYEDTPYDALLESYERGMTTAKLKEIFGELATKQADLIERIVNSPNQPDVQWLEQNWNTKAQLDFTVRVLNDMGYDFDAGRQDISVHPFTTNFDVFDVRVTTRAYENELFTALTGSIHEGGHALYEQGLLEKDRRTCLAEAPSLGIHESQSRMWENIVGRSKPFWNHYLPEFKKYFPGQMDKVTAEDIYKAVNHVKPSFIRVEADECTYNLHIIIRFEIEVALMQDDIKVAEVPELWNAKVKDYLGLDLTDDALGCLQDIHWSHGAIGYFPTYALGNLYSAQLFAKIEQDVPDLMNEIGNGNFRPLLDWLRTNVHAHGRRKTAPQIVRDATGLEPCSVPYLEYLERKYGQLYGLVRSQSVPGR